MNFNFSPFLFLLIVIAGCNLKTPPMMTGDFKSSSPPVFLAYNGKINLQGHSLPIEEMIFSADERFLYTISADRSTKVWDVQTGEVIRTVFHEQWWTEGTNAICSLPDNNIILQHGPHIEI